VAARAHDVSRVTRRAGARVALAARSTRFALASGLRAGAAPAALLIAVALFGPLEGPPARRAPERPVPAPARVASPPVAAPARAPAPRPVDVHVNARPWAHVWIDGIDLGATPLRHTLAPGRHRLAAEFPNGRRVEREIEVDARRRFVALP
jgi:PEGA domain